ncbi:MAG: CRISPR-associated helicase Cas3' [Aquabacterium sp.]|nr:CRISPR-associated helicase Cas3' [Aquabacterium sp.]
MTTFLPQHIAHHRASDDAWQSLEEHLLGVAALSRVFASKLGLDDVGELIGLLHDFGKYSQAFRNYLLSALGEFNQDEDEDWVDSESLKGKIDHSSAGAQFIWQALGQKSQSEQIAAQIFALCIASHHSGLIDCVGANAINFGEDNFTRRMSKAKEKTHLTEAIASADAGVTERARVLLADERLIEGIKTLFDNIVLSNTGELATSPHVCHQQLGLVVRFLFSCLIDADRIDTADFEHHRTRCFRPSGKYVEWPVLVDRLETHLRALAPQRPIDALRKEISEHCRQASTRPNGIYTLSVPTGGGKTLASLRFALHHAAKRQLDRVIFIIPFTSIIDQNAQVVRSILEPVSEPKDQGKIVLEHHGSVTPEQQTWREKILCENWDAPVVYTTMVQLLESLFGSGTRGARRMHQLANAVLIFDEVQTLPIKCVHLFNNAINFLVEHCNATVVLCTATQPLLHEVAKQKGAIRLQPEHELMPNVPELFDALKRVEICDRRQPGGWSYAQISDLALQELARAGSCLVIVNTKDAARQIFQRCQSLLDINCVFHLSTDMCPAHRKAVLGRKTDLDGNTVIARLELGLPVLCISTQLIEAGVDVDFGSVIRSLAGLDSIAQAAGRCNRNGRPELGRVHVVDSADESLNKLPDIQLGREISKRVLDDFKANPARYSHSLVGPEAMRDYYNYYFFQRKDEMAYVVDEKQVGHDDTLLNLLSQNDQATNAYGKANKTMPGIPFRQAFMTAAKAFKTIDAPTQGIVVPYCVQGKALIADLHAAFKLSTDFDLLRRAQQYSVNVFPHVLERLQRAGAVSAAEEGSLRILCLDERFYSPLFGLATEPVSEMEPLYVG